MAFKAHNPGCACCNPCILVDNINSFTYDDPSAFTPSGINMIVSGAGKTATATGVHPTSPYGQWASIRFNGEEGASLRIGISVSSDKSSGLYAEVDIDFTCTLKIIQRKNDIDEVLNEIEYEHTQLNFQLITLCFDPDESDWFFVSIQNQDIEGNYENFTEAGETNQHTNGPHFTYGTSSNSTSDLTVYAPRWEVQWYQSGENKIYCHACPCAECSGPELERTTTLAPNSPWWLTKYHHRKHKVISFSSTRVPYYDQQWLPGSDFAQIRFYFAYADENNHAYFQIWGVQQNHPASDPSVVYYFELWDVSGGVSTRIWNTSTQRGSYFRIFNTYIVYDEEENRVVLYISFTAWVYGERFFYDLSLNTTVGKGMYVGAGYGTITGFSIPDLLAVGPGCENPYYVTNLCGAYPCIRSHWKSNIWTTVNAISSNVSSGATCGANAFNGTFTLERPSYLDTRQGFDVCMLISSDIDAGCSWLYYPWPGHPGILLPYTIVYTLSAEYGKIVFRVWQHGLDLQAASIYHSVIWYSVQEFEPTCNYEINYGKLNKLIKYKELVDGLVFDTWVDNRPLPSNYFPDFSNATVEIRVN